MNKKDLLSYQMIPCEAIHPLGTVIPLTHIASAAHSGLFFQDADGQGYYTKSGSSVVYRDRANTVMGNLNVRELWYSLEDVIINPDTECLEQPWGIFPVGTFREDIWHWFESEFGVSIGKLMNDTDGFKYYLLRRPLSIGTVPNGFFDFDENDDTFGRYGAVYYRDALLPEQVKDYELMIAPY